MADDRVPLATSANAETVDYEALFNREGDQRRHSEKFATKTAIGEVHIIHNLYNLSYLYQVYTNS
jgi:hypothetical protein